MNSTEQRLRGRVSCGITSGRECSVCAPLDDRVRHEFLGIVRERTAKKGEVVVLEGDSGDGFFIVAQGRLRVFRTAPGGVERVLFVAEPGMTFGEAIFSGSGSYPASALAIEPSRLLFVGKAEFLALTRKFPEFSLAALSFFSQKVRLLYGTLETTGLVGAPSKIARYLLSLSKTSEENTPIRLPEKKKAIADRLNLAPETFSRILTEFKKKGWIAIDRGTIVIRDLHSLSVVAAFEIPS